MNRFRAAREEIAAGKVRLRGAELRHLRDVLRIGTGEHVEVFDGEGRAAVAVVAAIDRTTAQLTIVGPSERKSESPLAITLGVALPKGAKLDWVVEKTTELGVSRIVPFTSERTVPERQSFDAKVSRWRRIAEAAAAQSGRTACPAIDDVATFATILQQAKAYDRSILFWENGGASLGAASDRTLASIFVVTGAEGGFSADEAAAAAASGLEIASLGPRTLRAETAAIAAVVLAQITWGDLLMARSAW